MNKVYKIVWNKKINQWVVASELAKGLQNASTSVARVDDNPFNFFKKGFICMALLSALSGASAQSITVNTAAEFRTAVEGGAYDHITLGSNITLTRDIIVNFSQKNNIVIDGNHQYELKVTSDNSNGLRINKGGGTITLQNMSIDTENYYSMVRVESTDPDINVVYDNIKNFSASQHTFMRGGGGNSNAIATMGNMGVVAPVTRQEIGEINKMIFTGQYHVVHSNSWISFQNSSAVINTATMDFKKGADVKIDRTGTSANITNINNRAFAYTFEDGAKFELIAAQNILLGTNTNRGFRIGTYDAKGFGTGASIILNKTNTGAAYANGIDNATTNTTGINHNATGTDHVVFNLGDETDLRVTGTGISASKTTGSGGIYARNAGKIDADIGMHIEHNNGENGEVVLANQGNITSQTAGIQLLSTANKTMKLDGTSGSIAALSGAGIQVGTVEKNGNLNLNLMGGEINVSEGATGIEFNGNTANAHTITGTTINANGTTSTAIKHNNVNSHITFKDTHINIEDGIGFSDLNNKTFAKGDAGGTNQMTVKGTGTALRLAKDLSQLAGAHLNINVTDHTGVVGTTGTGVGVEITGGTAADVIKVEDGININATGATALKILGTVERELVNQGVITGYIRFDNGDVNNTITNTGTIDNLITHGGDDTLTIDNGASLLGVANLGEGQNKVYINNPSQIHGVMTGSGDDLFELSNIDSNNHAVIINQLDAGVGTNTLNVKDSIFKAQADTKFENFANIHLDKTALTLVASNNIATGTVHIDQLSALTLGDQYTGDFSASVVGDGTVTIDKGATVTFTGTNTGLTGNLTVAAGGTLNTNHLNQFGSGTTEVAGTLNHTANSLQTHLTGVGQLNLTGDQSAFNFDANVGSDFTGNVRLQNNTFNLSGTNTNTLANSTLSLSSGNTTTVEEQNQAVKNLELDGATLVFKDAGSIVTDHLSNTTKNSVIQVDVTDTESVNVIDQNSGVGKQLITANTSAINLDHLSLQDFTGQVLGAGTELEIKQNGHAVAEGTYHYTLKEHHGLALNYGLSKIDIHEDEILELNSTTSTSRVMNAQLTGLGGINLMSTAAGLTIDNALNDYQGATNVTAGMVTLGSDHALGQTAHLNLATGTTVDLSGHTQTIGDLTNAGSLDIAGGSLTLTGNGTSSAKDGLRGAGQLNIAGGDLSVSAENTNLSANVSIASDSALTLIKNATVGSGHIAIAGALKLQAMDTALSNTMSGAGSINVSDHSGVSLTADNTGFTGTFAIDGTSHLTATDFNQLGSGKVTIAESGIVNLNKITGELTNIISGDGNLNLFGTNLSLNAGNTHLNDLTGTLNLATGSNLTLAENGQLNDAAKVNVASKSDSITVNSTGDFSFNQNLIGSGLLDVQTAGNSFDFGKDVGSDFTGTVNLANSTFSLSGNNTAALKNATLVVGKGNTTTVDTENQTIGNLTLQGGQTIFKGKGSIATNTLASNGSSIIQVDLDAIAPTDGATANLFDQNHGQNHQLITANNNDGLKLSDLTLQGLDGSAIGQGTIRNVDQNDQKVAEGTYNYALNNAGGLGISYGLSALNIVDGQTLTLDSISAANKNMTATLTGTGNLTLTSDDKGLTLTNEKNAYTGVTNVTKGLVTAGSDHAFGKTSQLNLAAGAAVDLNGKTQTVGSLKNEGKFDLAAGSLTITNAGGGASTSSGSLVGAGDLTISAGDLSITSANNELAANIGIHSGASVSLSNAGTLGSSTVAIDGALNLRADTVLNNTLIGKGAVNTQANVTLNGDNSGFTGAQNIGDKASLTVSNQSALGSGQVNFGSETSTLNLNGVASAVQNVLNGAGIVNITDNAIVNFSTDNKGFTGTFAVDGTSQLTTTDFSQLGKGSVSIVQGGAVNLDKMTGELTNSMSGDGNLNLSGTNLSLNSGNTHLKDLTGMVNLTIGSNLTLAENGQLNDAAKVNISSKSDSFIVNSSGEFNFNNHLIGSGLLDVKTVGNSFNFGKDVGNDFAGTVNLENTQFNLSGDNAQALQNANLSLGSSNVTTVGAGTQTIGGLTLNGGHLLFNSDKETINTGTLSSTGVNSIVTINTEYIPRVDVNESPNLFDQLTGLVTNIITAKDSSGLNVNDLTLKDQHGKEILDNVHHDIVLNSEKIADSTYNYHLVENKGLGVTYGLVALDILDGKTLTLDSTTINRGNNKMTAKITGQGNLTLTSDDQGMIIDNSHNAYTGATNVTVGLVKAGSDNAFGQTSQLNLAAGTTVDLNGKTQVVGSLKNEGKFDLAAGALTITNEGGASTSSGELIGAGDLMIAAGDFNITTANKDLAASIGIHSGASVSLSNAGTLGTSQIAIDGVLNLNDDATFGNTLSGSGVVNTNADIALTGDNSGFTGAQNIGNQASLTVSNQSALGLGQVNFATIDSKLNLNGVASAVQNVLHGSGIVNITDNATVNFSADNKDFTGTFAVDGTSQLTTTDFSQLGKGSVSLMQGGAVNLGNITSELTNSINGDGNLNLSGTDLSLNTGNTKLKDLTGTLNLATGSNLTLVENGQLNDAAKVNIAAIGDSVTVNSNGDFSFNNNLVGSGLLDVRTAGNSFNFGKGVGSDFAGTVNLANSTFSLSGNNTAALKNATLVVGTGNITTVDTENQTIGNLTLDGGQAVFKGKSSIITNTLASNGTSIIQVDLDAIAPTDGTAANLFDQNSGQNHQLITANNNDGLKLSDLTLQGLNGNAVGESTIRNIDQNDQKVAEGTYNYALNKTDGLGINYGLSALNIVDGQTLTLDSTSAANKNMTATLIGTGNLTLTSDDQGLTLTNDKNTYTGATNVTAGLVKAGSDHAFGQTSQLNLAAGTTVDLNGKTQTVGSLNNLGEVNLAGGALTISNANGAISTSSGSLVGAGKLAISSGDLSITSVNNDLAANIDIHSSASISLSETGTLGSSTVAIDGALNLRADTVLNNTLIGKGAVNTQANVTLSGDNLSFTGAQNIGNQASLTVSNQAALGSGQVNFVTTDSKLKLTGVTSAVQNVLHGSGIVNIANGSAVNFSNDNKDFTGIFAVDGTSHLTTTDFNQLGSGKVTIAESGAVNLNKITGELTNTISGDGSLNLSGTDLLLNAANTHLKDLTGTLNIATGSNLTLAENGQLNDAAKVNITTIGDSVTVNSTGNFSFNNHLTGSGSLDIKTAGNSFNFGKDVGSDFAGTMNLESTQFNLSGDNAQALQNANLSLGAGNITTVGTGTQTIGSLTLNGGHLLFNSDKEKIAAGTLSSTGNSIVTINTEYIPRVDVNESPNLFDQLTGLVTNIITAKDSSGLNVNDLTLKDQHGKELRDNVHHDIVLNSEKIADSTYNYHLVENKGLGVTYGLVAIDILDGKTLTLDSTTISRGNNKMTAKITGQGNLTLTSDDQGMIVDNSRNAYTGATNVTAGLVKAGSDNAFGQTSQLNLAAGTTVDLNGQQQSIGRLTNAGTLNLAGGSLTMTEKGSTSSGALMGAGDLIISGGDLNITTANTDLMANVAIHSGAAIQLSETGSLGNGAIDVSGTLDINNGHVNFKNALSGSGKININDNVALTADANTFSGTLSVNDKTLSVTSEKQLGTAKIVNHGTVDLNLLADGRWVNQMTGTGDFIKSGNGTLRVASQLLHTGNTEIKAGTVFLEKGAVLGGTNQKSRASMAGTLNIAQGSTLAGTGTVNQTVNNYGTIDVNLRDVRQSPDRDYAQGNATLTVNHDVNNYNKIYIGNANTTAGNRLIINGNYTAGDNAVLYMNTDLGNQTTSLSDQLIVSGNISGKTKLYVTDIGNVAGGMTSPLGIKIIDAGSSDDNAFELQNTVVKGINEYVLSRNAEDQDWYLTSYRDLYRPDVGSTMANSMGTIRSQLPGYGSHISGALAAGSGGLRALDRNMTADGQYLGSVWFNETGTHDKGNIAGDQIHYTYKGFASVLGADTGFRTGDSLVIIGGMISTSSMDSKGWNRITESRSTGSISGQSIGLYGSWFKNADDALSPFIDYTISYGKYDNTVTTLNNASSSYDSRLWTVSVQGGYPMAIGENLVVEPQAQISYIDYKVDNYRDFNGTDIREQQKGHVISRVGAYVYPKTGDIKPYAAFNLWYDDIASKVSYDDRSLSSGKPGLFYEAKLGVQAKMSENFTINSEINYRQGKHKHKNYNVNIGFKYQF
ncbi:ESPR-type extended signal peptide-containing protein [Wohlfahrtiimonas chitiniclastica]|uniref:ESPR-type extended signal peptide-containing protein n=1 Tax=Wohlfahrtiimonas chitiniclastica TaxID=400946 RepID=UPI00215759E3|nr:ESPR-type extended signal peptide-containing protein [Wohlfahrtiimonas chitiniclastica]MDC7251282.1 autotransporter [Wohlfahrtiimonas chitiniclastica]